MASPLNLFTVNPYAWSDRPRLTFVLDTLGEVRLEWSGPFPNA